MATTLIFNGVTLTPVTHQHGLWIRAAELARALGYAREELVSRIYQRNADEFTSDMTQVIEISAEHQNGVLGSAGRCRIFSLRGCHLVAMFSRTKVAKAFRRWVLDLLERLEETPGQEGTQAQRHNITEDIIPTPSFAPEIGWQGESVICAADGRPMRILQPLPASALQTPLRQARAELGELRKSLLDYAYGGYAASPGILLPLLDSVLDNVDELLIGLQRSPELQ